MKEIKLTQNKVALVDDEDFSRLSLFKWYANHERGRWYARRQVRKNGKQTGVKLHREILNAKPGQLVDHINGDGLDNRKENLRISSDSENQRNKGLGSNNTSGYKGVSWIPQRNKWKVKISVNKKAIFIGYFDDVKEAAIAYNTAALKHHGSFARLNKIESL